MLQAEFGGVMEHHKIKKELYSFCQEYLQKRIRGAQQAITDAQQAANQETKSSSGDKYETTRSMMQLEIEKNSVQLAESLKLKNAIDQINPDSQAKSVQPGSLVVTESDVFFVAISVGKVILHNKPYLIISPASPMGVQLMGLKAGESFSFKDRTYVLREII